MVNNYETLSIGLIEIKQQHKERHSDIQPDYKYKII